MSSHLPTPTPDSSPERRALSAILTERYGLPYGFQACKPRTPVAGEVLVRIDYSGVCHGDIYGRDGGGPAPAEATRPLIGGHEGAGEIVEIGDDESARASGFSIGDAVGIAWRSKVCKSCDACMAGSENHCPEQTVVGLHRDGTFQRYIVFPIDQLIRLPSNLDREMACPILCAGVTSYLALRTMQPVPGKWCAIVGASGGVGHLAIQYAKRVFGLKVLAIDGERTEKEAFCRAMGCDEYVDFMAAGPSLAEEVKRRTGGGADYVLVLSPHQSAYDAAGEYTRFRGQIMAIGIGACHMPLRPILKRHLTIRSSQTGTKADIEEALQYTVSGLVRGRTEVMDIVELNEALDRIKKGRVRGKLVVDLRGLDHPPNLALNGVMGQDHETLHRG